MLHDNTCQYMIIGTIVGTISPKIRTNKLNATDHFNKKINGANIDKILELEWPWRISVNDSKSEH